MKRAILGSFANLTMPDLNVMNDEGLSAARLRIELLSGLTVALALIPEAVAFAFVAGVHPLVGLYAAFLVGLITAVIGGARDDFWCNRGAGGCDGRPSCTAWR